ncbi:MAG: hypothetical protein ACRCTF_07255 [Bacteroidales bacterium]
MRGKFVMFLLLCVSLVVNSQVKLPTPMELEDRFFEITKFADLEQIIESNTIEVDIAVRFNKREFPLHVVTKGMERFRGKTTLFGFNMEMVRDGDNLRVKVLGIWTKHKIPQEDNNPILNFAQWKEKRLVSRLDGDSIIGGVATWVVQYDAANETHRMHVSKGSGLVLQVRSQYRDEKTGKWSDYLLEFDNYRMFMGVYAPHKMVVTSFESKRVYAMEIKSAVVRNEIPLSYFD